MAKGFNSIEEALEDLKKGKCIVVADNEDRENEGDLVCAAEFATPEAINFMISKAKGLLCMPVSTQEAKRLGFVPMVANNTDNHETAFTVTCRCEKKSTPPEKTPVSQAKKREKTKTDLQAPHKVSSGSSVSSLRLLRLFYNHVDG